MASSAELAGKKVAQLEWTGGLNADINGPTVDFDTNFSRRGVLEYPARPDEAGLGGELRAVLPGGGLHSPPPAGPTCRRVQQPAQQTTLTLQSTSSALNPDRTFDLYVYASRPARLRPGPARPVDRGKDGSQSLATLVPGQFSAIKLMGANGLIGTAAGESAGFYVKVMTMAGDLSKFSLYFTSVTRPNAHCSTAACNALPAGAPGEDQLAKYIADNLPPAVFGDFAPEEAGIIDEDTWYQQVVDLNQAYDLAVFKYVLGTLQPDTDVLLAGTDQTDEVSHQILGLLTPTAPDGIAEPVLRPGGRHRAARPPAWRSARPTSRVPTTRPTRGWAWCGR